MIFLKEFFEKVDFEKYQQTTKKQEKTHAVGKESKSADETIFLILILHHVKTYLTRPVNHLKRPVTHLDDQWNFSAKMFWAFILVPELSCIQKCILYMKILLV